MHQAYLQRSIIHLSYKFDQSCLIRMRRIPADAVHACADIVALAIELYISVARAEALNSMAGRASALIADEQHVVPRVTQHGLEIVDDAAAGAHAVASDDDGRSGAAGQVIQNSLVVCVAVDGDQLLERQRPSAGLHTGLGFFVPVVFEFA